MGNEPPSVSSLIQTRPENPGLVLTEHHAQSFLPLQHGNWESIPGGYTRRIPENSSNHIHCAHLDEPPLNIPLFFDCSECNRKVYDGGLNKICYCDCGKTYLRTENGEFTNPGEIERGFERVFQELSSIPSGKYIPSLVSVNLGIFREGVPPEFLEGGRPEFSRIYNFYLCPYFKNRIRCLGIGEYFEYGDGKFKVIGAYPSYGIITENTTIQCSEVLFTHNISRVQISAIKPSLMDPRSFNREIVPYFKSMPRHIHKEEYLFIGNEQYIIEAAQPTDGIIDRETEFYIEGEALETLTHIALAPCVEDLSIQLQTISRACLIDVIFSEFLMPHFQGFKRICEKDSVFPIKGVNFRVLDCWPEKGVITDLTVIIYEGSLSRREVNFDLMFMHHLNRGPYSLMDPMSLLTEEMQNIQGEFGEAGLVSGADPESIETLPTHRIESLPEDPEAAKCMICMSEYVIGDDTRTLPCFHMYHINCIDEWLNRNKLCPICKTSIDMDN